MIKEYFLIALNNLKSRPLRSWLTILGIVIGVFLVVSLVSLSEGLKDTILGELKIIGKDILLVVPGDPSNLMAMFLGGLELSDSDINAIKRADGVEKVIATPWKAETARYENESKLVLIYGSSLEDAISIYREDMGWGVVDGNWPRPGKREALVGNLVPKDIFPGLKPGDSIAIKGRQFEIAGVLRSLGNRQDDSMISVDLSHYKAITGHREGAQAAMVKITSGFDADVVAENTRTELEKTRKRTRIADKPDFTVVTMGTATAAVNNILNTLRLVVFIFASIALFVGGIGIMNTMYTAVRERTKEIGILKAVGARRSAITSIFLIESGIIGLVGGAGGVVFGILGAKLVEIYGQFHPVIYITAKVSPSLVIFGLGFSFLVGSVAGFFPSRQAAKMNPVDALRYE